MEIRFLGTGSINATRFSASALIDHKILIDAGNGIVKQVKQLGEELSKIRVVLITHLHGDHFFDLMFFMIEKERSKVPGDMAVIYGPKGTYASTKALFDLSFPGMFEDIIARNIVKIVEFESLDHELVTDDISVSSVRVAHADVANAFGYVLTQGSLTVGFTGDSRPCDGVDAIAQNCSTGVFDMTLKDEANYNHLGLNDIEQICNRYPKKKIFVTHMNDPTREAGLKKGIRNLIIPDDGDRFEITKSFDGTEVTAL